MRRYLYALAAVELICSVFIGSKVFDAVSSIGLPDVAAVVSQLLGIDDPNWLHLPMTP